MASPRNIDSSIHNLLFDNDCVVVPNFGGFVALYKSSQISSDGKLISPPSKTLSFNRKLQNNDGLLANHLAKTTGVSFETAMNAIQKEILDIQTDLDNNNRIEIAGVGVIYVDKESNYRFLPDAEVNFLKASYGLKSLQANPKVVKEETTIIPIIPIEKGSKKRRWVAAVLIPVFLAGAYVLSMAIQKDDFSMATLNPFNWNSEVVTTDFTPREKLVEVNEQEDSQSLESLVEQSSEKTVNISFVEDTDAKLMVVNVPEKEVVTQIVDEVVPNSEKESPKTDQVLEDYTAKGWFVVGGAFQEYPNAQKLVKILRKDGFNAFIFGKSGSLHLVCVEQFQSKKEAKKALKEIKSSGRKEAWLKRK